MIENYKGKDFSGSPECHLDKCFIKQPKLLNKEISIETYLQKNWNKGSRCAYTTTINDIKYELTKKGNNILIERGIKVKSNIEWQYIFDGYIDTMEELEFIFKLLKINETGINIRDTSK